MQPSRNQCVNGTQNSNFDLKIFMSNPNDSTQNYHFVDYSQWLKCFDTILIELSYQNLIKFPKVQSC